MKLEVGLYVRYKNFTNVPKIAKITKIVPSNNECYENYYQFDNGDGTLEGFIIKTSHNIIDLIEVGDIIAYFISNKDTGLRRINNIEMLDRFKNGDKILSVLTKEQFEQISYKVGD